MRVSCLIACTPTQKKPLNSSDARSNAVGRGDVSEDETAPPVRNIRSVKSATLWFPSENLAVLFIIVWKMKDGWLLVLISTAISPYFSHTSHCLCCQVRLCSTVEVIWEMDRRRDERGRDLFFYIPRCSLTLTIFRRHTHKYGHINQQCFITS